MEAAFLELIGYLWWVWLFLLAWFYYSWAKNHLPFSPLLSLGVGAVLVYYLVFEHPILGSLGYIGSILLFSGIIWLLPFVAPFFRFGGR